MNIRILKIVYMLLESLICYVNMDINIIVIEILEKTLFSIFYYTATPL